MKSLLFLFKNIFYLLFLSLLAACSPVKLNSPALYLLSAVPHQPVFKRPHAQNILVMYPETVPAYNTTEMAYRIGKYRIGYYAFHKWAETPSQMLYPLLIQSLQNINYFHAVTGQSSIGKYNYILSTHILKFEQNYSSSFSSFTLFVRAQLLKSPSNHIIATKNFIISEPIPSPSPYSGVIAANKATFKFLSQLNHFLINQRV